ncbi:MAG: hypothetical protein WBG46_10840 [Nonlabens sp.]
MDQNIKKIKGQKNAAVFLIAGALAVLIHRLWKVDFQAHPTTHSYIICGASIVIIAVGITGFIRSSRKLKNLR